MCEICTRVREIIKDKLPTSKTMALTVIASYPPTSHMDKLLDEVLGTGLTEEDPEKAAAWERSRR